MTVRNMSFKDARFFSFKFQFCHFSPSLISGSSLSISKSLSPFLQSENSHVYQRTGGRLKWDSYSSSLLFLCWENPRPHTYWANTLPMSYFSHPDIYYCWAWVAQTTLGVEGPGWMRQMIALEQKAPLELLCSMGKTSPLNFIHLCWCLRQFPYLGKICLFKSSFE